MTALVEAIVDTVKSRNGQQEELFDWFLNNASAVHGVPKPAKRSSVPSSVTINLPAPKDEPKPTRPAVETPTEPAEKIPTWKKITGATLAAVIMGAGGWAIGSLVGGDEQPVDPTIEQPAGPTFERSLLQALEDEGRHLPEGAD